MRPFGIDEPKKDAVVISPSSTGSLASGGYHARLIRVAFAAAVVCATVMGAGGASAQTLIWAGGNGPNWSTRQNWTPQAIPSAGVDLIFPVIGSNRVTTNDLTDLRVNSITIRDAYTIGGNQLEITGDPGINLVSLQTVTATLSLNLTLNRQPLGVATDGGTLVLSGRVTSSSFEKRGVGTLVLSGNNDIIDLVSRANCGVIRATSLGALGPTRGTVDLAAGCTLRVEANTTLDKPISINGTGAPGSTGALVITGGVTLTERLDLHANSAATISVLSGATLDLPEPLLTLPLVLNSPLTWSVAGLARVSREIRGTGDLIKENTGTLSLSDNNTYNGQTIIRGGTVNINGAVQRDSPVILDGGTLSGGGTVGTISATAAGGTISVGNTGAELLEGGSVTMNASTTVAFEVNGTQHDQLNVRGTVTLGNAILNVTGLPPQGSFVLIDNDLTDAVVGTFAGLPEGATVLLGGVDFRISYRGGDGNDVVLDSGGASEVLTGTYVGNGADGRQITGLGFHPDVVIIKANAGLQAVGRTATMTGDVSKNMSTGEIVSNAIQSLDPGGFTVGNGLQGNFSFVTYQWVAWKTGVNEMKIGTYTGTGATRSITGLNFSPDIVFVLSSNGDEPVHKVRPVVPAATAFSFSGVGSTNYITALGTDGFTVGTDARVNQTGVLYHYVAWNEIPGKIDVGTYTGNGADNRNIAGVGFQPDFLMVQTNNALPPVAHSTAMGPSTDASHFFTAAANQANEIQVLQSSGFQVGSAPESNESARTFTYAAWGRAAPTAVGMAAMSARRTAKGVVLEWRTGYEVDNLGFHVYRGPENSRVRLTTSLLAGSGLQQSSNIATGASPSYRWSDETAGAGAPDVEYWVEEIALSGARIWHGPVRPEMSVDTGGADAGDTGPTSPGLGELTRSRAAPSTGVKAAAASAAASSTARSSPRQDITVTAASRAPQSSAVRGPSPAGTVAPLASAAALWAQWSIASRAAVKIDVASSGWYRLTQPALVAAGLPVPVNSSSLQLFVDGVERPLRVNGAVNGRFGQSDSVEFYATGADTPYTGTRTYWIVSGNSVGRRIPIIDGRNGGLAGPASFPASVEWKPRSIFFGALENGDKENFFGPLILPGESTSQLIELPDVIAPAPADAELEVALQGVTEIDHRVGVTVNGIDVGEVTFTGLDAGVGTFAISQALLIDGANTFSLDARGGELDETLVDYIRVTYHRRYHALANQLTFSADAGQQVAVGGFTTAGIRVIDITGDVASHEVRGRVSSDGAGWQVTLTVPGTGLRTLIAVTADAEVAPLTLRPNVPSTLHQAGQAGDIIMIAPAAFQAALAPLKAFREGQGYTARLVDIEDVYDEFSFGQKTPQAIKDFLVRATGQWSKPPRFLLLVGNATQDPRDYFGTGEPDYVPTKVVQTGGIESASDDWFVDANDDGFADMAFVGRLPARSEAQVAAMVSKIISYEQPAGGDWQRSALLVSDQNLPDGFDFAAENDLARELVPTTYQVTHLRRGIDPDAGAAVKARLSEGTALVSYAGHGSVAAWELDLLTTDDVPGLTNGSKLPVVIALACLNGFFQSLFPEESLAEALVRAPNGGAVGVWASSGITSPQWQWRMNLELYRQIFQGGWLTIGEAMRAAKQIVGDPDVRRTWIYFGDPATRFTGRPTPPAATVNVAAPAPTPQRPVAAAARNSGAPTDSKQGAEPAALPLEPAGVRLADFDADRRGDLFLVEPQSGLWFAAFGGRGDFSSVPGQWSVAGVPIAADLNGDGRSDLFVYDASTGEWLQAMNMPDGGLITYKGAWRPGYRIATGDFDGDGRDGVFGLSPETGDWFQAAPDGRGGFTYRFGGGLHDGEVRVADFNGDSRADVFVYDPSTGRWTLMLSGADGPTFERGNWGPGWDVSTARLNADGQADLFLWDAESGRWRGCIRDGAAPFVCSSGVWSAGGRVYPLDLDGDGRDELLRYDASTGRWTLTGVSPSGEVIQAEGEWEAGWTVAIGDSDGDGRDDLALYHPESGRLIRRLSHPSAWPSAAIEAWPVGWRMVGRQP